MGQKKYLVGLKWVLNDSLEPIVICETREKAQEWITKEMEGKQYNGMGFYKIIELPFIN